MDEIFILKDKTIFNLGSKKNTNIKKIKYLTLSKDKILGTLEKSLFTNCILGFFLHMNLIFGLWI
jgi:hypothetical protein